MKTTVRVGVSGEVMIIDEKGNIYKYKNQVQQQLIQAIIQYAQVGGTISNYAYTIQLFSNNILVGSYPGSLSYKQVSTALQLIFTFIITNAPSSANILQLYIASSLGNFLIAQVSNVTLPSGTLQIIWTISFNISIQDYFTPYLIFAFFSPAPFINVPLQNVQYALNAIQNIGYLTSPPTYYVTYNGQYIQVTASFTNNSISVYYQFQSISLKTTYTNLDIVVSASNGYVNLLPPVQQAVIQVGQSALIFYNATWVTS
jgi:hypothetical protein